ncbi:retrovirus-related pol polyprotein from transposon TNT 1-94 [Tanacetum coccineum]
MDDLIRDRNAKLAAFQQEIDTLKETLSNNVKEKKSLSKTLTVFKTKPKEKESKYIDKEIVLEKQNKELEIIIWKNVVNIAVSKPNATVALGMYKLDIEALSPRLKNNKGAQETDSLKSKDSNKPLLTSTRVKPTTSDSGSKHSGNTKNNRITRPPCSNQKNKVEDHSNNVKSSLNKKNYVSEPISNALVKRSMRNAKFKSMRAICNKCLFDANHDMCLINHVNDENVRSKSKSKRNKKRKAWKPTGPLRSSLLAKVGLARGIPKLKFQKDHLCSACALGKSKKSSHKPNVEDTNQEKLYLLHMDLCGPMHVESINGKKYILVIVNDYSGFTWVKFLRSKDEAPDPIIKCIKNIQVRLKATVCNVRTDNRTKFVNQTLRDFYENVGISPQTSVARTPQQNSIVERRNRTLVEAARTMLIF